ncbi:ABC transporter permease [Cumulibacter manganitolerans]|uniref:ABC transporter permease n=1 Tax=Cumulibacter manganitolerans TaxID=1884992 RepID=UPI0012967B3E|nr:ABC transporter permease [Cumulibacter manganitolerans]
MSILEQTAAFFGSSANWHGDRGIPASVGAHLGYCLLSFAIAAVIAVPVGLYIGHTGRGALLAVNIGNVGRALPTIGLLTLVVLATGGGVLPVAICLALLAVPPLLTATYTGVRQVDPDVVDAARGMGMTEREILTGVEIPNAMPTVFSGVRSAALQLVSTATVAAFVGMGGLGRYILDGPPQQDYGKMAAGALLVALLALAVDLALAGLARVTLSPPLRARSRTSSAKAGTSA